MKLVPFRVLACGVLAFTGLAAPLPPGAGDAEAAQPWYCVCNGVKKRHLASTRHCEHQMKLPKGKSCSAAQFRAVYGPACRERGCRLPPV